MPAQKGDAFKTHSDLSKTKKILNYKPRVTFQKGLTNFIEWFKSYYKIKLLSKNFMSKKICVAQSPDEL